MFNLQNKKRSEYSVDDLAAVDATSADYWDKSRVLESESVNDLEKHLWLANGAAATVSIGFVQAHQKVSIWQHAGAWAFVFAILFLIVLKYVSATNASRDRARFQEAKSRFDAEEISDVVFRTVRDRTFRILKRTYIALQWGAGLLFTTGCIFTLVGVAHAA